MSEQRVVVMGLGNLLWADEGFGVRVAERLYAHYHWPEYVEIVDGGTQGLNLLGYVESASHLLILDAIDYGLEPGLSQREENEPASEQFLRSAGAGRYPRTSASTYCPRRSATRYARRLRRQPERTGTGSTARCGTIGVGATGCVGNCAATG